MGILSYRLMGSVLALCGFFVQHTILLYEAVRTSTYTYEAQYSIYSYVQHFYSTQCFFFFVGSSMNITCFMTQITMLTICIWLQLLYYCLQLHHATLLHSTLAGQLQSGYYCMQIVWLVVHYIQGQKRRIDQGTTVVCLWCFLSSY